MPYILQNNRDRLDVFIDGTEPLDAGELNYMFTRLAQKYLNKHGERYQYINDIVGALECAKLEFYRRLVAPYEDTKITENGDVY